MKISYNREHDILISEFIAVTTKITMKSMNETPVEAIS